MKNRMHLFSYLSIVIIFQCFTGFLFGQANSIKPGRAESIEQLQQRFVELPAESRRLTGPLFWLHGDESKEQLESYVEKVAEGGNGCFTAESRPHSDWLGEGWYRDLKICLDAAKKHDLKMWIFDEKWWPSGEVGGKVPQQYGSKYLQAEAMSVKGPETFSYQVQTDKLIAVLAARAVAEKIDSDSLIDLTESIKDGLLNWKVPQGSWKIMVFSWRYSEGRHGSFLVDGASQDAVDWYIQTVYQPHYDRFKDDFGTWIPGFFYDEPETYGDWGTQVIPILKERGVDWKKTLAAWKYELAGDQQQAAKYQYQDAFAEAWGRTLFGGITAWCHEHHVRSIGHFLEHGRAYLSQHACAGNMFQLQKYSDMGGIDAVFTQFVMGRRQAQDGPCWQTPKLGSSISHVYGKPDDVAMVEIFGARGQDLTYPEMKWWTDHMHVSGINFHIPHSFNPRSPYDTDCPPYFYNGGKEPRWPLYKIYADYTSRLSLMLSGGRHVCPVALLFVGSSYHVGKAVPPDQISEALQDALYDCDWMPYEVFENDVRLNKNEISLHQEQYRVLIVPPAEVIPYKTLKKACEFFESGGIVIAYDFLPGKASDIDRSNQGIADLKKTIWGNSKMGLSVCRTNAAGGRSYFLPANPTPQQLQQVLTGDADLHPTLQVIEGDTNNWLHVLHRVKDGRDIFFICNQDVDPARKNFRFRIKANGFPEYWDSMRGEITSIPFTRDGEYAELTLQLDSLESALLVFNPIRRDLPEHVEFSDMQTAKVLPVTPVSMQIPAPDENPLEEPLEGCEWVWLPGQGATTAVPPGSYYFRKTVTIPSAQQITNARFVGTADNEIELYVNGNSITDQQGGFSDWKKVSDVEITDALAEGVNTIAIKVLNLTDQPSPAGLIGKVELMFKGGLIKTVPIDQKWKAHARLVPGWQKKDFDDSNWSSVATIVPFGAGPWGTFSYRILTLSPVKQAKPFIGRFELPKKVNLQKQRCILQMGSVQPETGVRISVNGKFAGGCIGNPLYKDITQYLATGKNIIRIEPFTPDSVQALLVPYQK